MCYGSRINFSHGFIILNYFYMKRVNQKNDFYSHIEDRFIIHICNDMNNVFIVLIFLNFVLCQMQFYRHPTSN